MQNNLTLQDYLKFIVDMFNINSGSKVTALDIKYEDNPYVFLYTVKRIEG